MLLDWKVKGGNQSASNTIFNTDSSTGRVSYDITPGDSSRKTMVVPATLQSDTSKTNTVDVQFGAGLPQGIIGLSPGVARTQQDAQNFCANQGGKLPLFGGSLFLQSASTGTIVDGMAAVGSNFPSGIPAE